MRLPLALCKYDHALLNSSNVCTLLIALSLHCYLNFGVGTDMVHATLIRRLCLEFVLYNFDQFEVFKC